MVFKKNQINPLLQLIRIIEEKDITPDTISVNIEITNLEGIYPAVIFELFLSKNVNFSDLNKFIAVVGSASQTNLTYNIYTSVLDDFEEIKLPRVDPVETNIFSIEECAKKVLLLLRKHIAEGAERNLKECRDFIRMQLEDLHSRNSKPEMYTYYRTDFSLRGITDTETHHFIGRKNEIFEFIFGTSFDKAPSSLQDRFNEIIFSIENNPRNLKSSIFEFLGKGRFSLKEIQPYLD